MADPFHAGFEHAGGRPSPSRVEQGAGPSLGMEEIDGDAVSQGDGQQEPGPGGNVSIQAALHAQPGERCLVHADGRPVVLSAHDDSREARAHHRLKNRPVSEARFDVVVPSLEPEAPFAIGYAGRDAERSPPAHELVARDGRMGDVELRDRR